MILQGYHGLGRHTKTISKKDLQTFDKIGFFQSMISALTALGLLKISIALFLLRLSKNKWYSRSLWALIGKGEQPAGRSLEDSVCGPLTSSHSFRHRLYCWRVAHLPFALLSFGTFMGQESPRDMLGSPDLHLCCTGKFW